MKGLVSDIIHTLTLISTLMEGKVLAIIRIMHQGLVDSH